MLPPGLATRRSATRARRPLPPRDTLLPRLRELLRPEPAAYALLRTLVAGAQIDDLRVRLVDYVPGSRCTVLYDVTIDGERHAAVARVDAAQRGWAAAGAPTAPRAAAPIARPMSWDHGLGALVHWFPHDPAIPVLELPAAVLRALVGALPDPAPVQTLHYRPGARAVLRVGDVVLQAYGDARGYEAGVRGLALAAQLGGEHAVAPPPSHRSARVTTQPLVEGDPVRRARALEVAPRAGAMLRELHGAVNPGLDVTSPRAQLATASRSAELVATVAPSLARRVRRLTAQLELAAPAADGTVVSHGDLNLGRLLDAGGELVLLDFDDACLATPALDVAAFAAGVVNGRDGDLDDARAVLEATIAGYGVRPRNLEWHLAGHAAAPRGPPLPPARAALARAHRRDRRRGRGGARVMRLVMLVSGFPRRSETFALNELLALDDAGCLAAIFATKPGETGAMQPGAERLLEKVHVLAPGTAAEQADEVVARVGDTPVDGVHGYFAHLPTEVAEQAAQRLGVPYGFSVHALDARRAGSEGLGRRARGAACVIACNPDVAGEVQRAGGSVTLVPHGVDVDRFPATPAPAGDDGPLRLLAVGRLVAKKGFDTLVDAVALLRADVRLRIVGAGPLHEELEQRIDAAGLGDRVELCGPRGHGELPAEYAAAQIVVVPSVQDAGGDRDGLPNVVLEAMASARAVVASDVGAVASAIEHARTGVLVAPGDARELACAIELLAADPALRARLAQAAGERVRRDFDLRSCTAHLQRRLEAVYA